MGLGSPRMHTPACVAKCSTGQCLPGVLDRIDWIAPNGRTYRATSPDGLRAATHAGYATASTFVAW